MGSSAKPFAISISRIAIKGLGYGYNSNNSNILIKSITYAEQTVTNVPVVPILPAKSITYIFKKLLAVSDVLQINQLKIKSLYCFF